MWNLLLLSCISEPLPGSVPPTPLPLPIASCGETYTWQPLGAVGSLLASERVPEGDLTAALGELLLAETAGVTLDLPFDTEAHRIRYQTQDRGELVEATALVILPVTDEEVPTLLWVHPTMGFADGCGPTGAGVEMMWAVGLYAALGYAVVAPDLLGMTSWGTPSGTVHPYIVPEPTAVASLDSVRALWHLAEDRPISRRLAFTGQSEGGFGALWAERYAASYLPEAQPIGVAAAVPPVDLVSLAAHGLSTLGDTSEALVAVLATSWLWHGKPGVLTDALAPPIAEEIFTALGEGCDPGALLDDASSTADLFAEPLRERFEDPWSCILEGAVLSESTLPRQADTPVLMINAEEDALVWHAVTREAAAPLCDAGYALTYVECAGADHVEGAVDSLNLQLTWLRDRKNGVPVVEDCVIGTPEDCTQL